MTKRQVPLRVDDITGFTRALSQQLGTVSPGHLSLMNMVARAAGFQNLQHMRAATAAGDRMDTQVEEKMADARTVERTLHQFDQQGRLRQWPSRRAVQTLALWALWATLPANQTMTERQVNDHFAAEHLFKDPATLRRTMISCRLLTRRTDGSDYRRLEKEPPAEAKALIKALGSRRSIRENPVKQPQET